MVVSYLPAMADCNVMIAGKGVTADGSILFAKSEDYGTAKTDFAFQVPRKQHPTGSVVKLYNGGTVPQVSETYAYKYFECPPSPYSNAIVNEWGLALGSNGCSSKVVTEGGHGNFPTEEQIKWLEAEGEITDGGIGTMFRIILAERCKTAKEAVLLAVELLDEYGYTASGRNLNIVDKNEAWNLQMATGRHYVARKVQDDEVFIIANTFNIHEIDFDDKENWITAPGLVEYAIKRGWYDPADGEPFDFAFAYAPLKNMTADWNTHRHWNLGRQLSSTFMSFEEAAKGWIPTTVKPDNTKLTPKDLMKIIRNHLEGTPADFTNVPGANMGVGEDPHTTKEFTNCNVAVVRVIVYQARSWLPDELQLMWYAPDHSCTTGFIPWYVGMTNTPEAWRMVREGLGTTERGFLDYHFNPADTAWLFDYNAANSVFSLLGFLVDSRWERAIKGVQETWAEYEDMNFALQKNVEAAALNFYQEDPALAREFLTLYSFAQSEKALKIAKELINKFRVEFFGRNYFGKDLDFYYGLP